MRKATSAAWLCLCLLAALTGGLAAQGKGPAANTSDEDLKREVLHWLESGHLNLASFRQAFKAAAPAARPALMTKMLSSSRAYTETPAFKGAYDRRRSETAPTAPKPRNVDAELAKQKAEQEKSIAEMKKNLPNLPADIRPQMEATIKQLEADFAKRNADPQMAATMRQATEMQAANERRDYQESVAQHEKRFPADPRVLIADRLRQFLQVSKDVDFNARLVKTSGQVRFENPAYERQSAEWKLFYRAGRESMDAARQFAQAWLDSLK